MLAGIIRPRMEEIFEMIRSKIEVAGMDTVAGRRVVLTGGGSQLLGARELATRVLGRQVRLAKPRAVGGLADAVSGPAFSSAIGMLEYARRRTIDERQFDPTRKPVPVAFKRIAQWFKDNF
jgi:cell division protein FtsA